MSEDIFQIYALRYGTNQTRRRVENLTWTAPDDIHDAAMPMDFFIWVLVGKDRTVLVDTGSAADTMRARGHKHIRPPLDCLRENRGLPP